MPPRWLAVVLAGLLLLSGCGGGEEAEKAETAPVRWDPRIVELVRFVERARGLDFEHPVPTSFLADRAFRAEVTRDGELTEEDAAELEHVAGLFRALGLVTGELDLRESTNELNGEEIVGLYDPEEDRVIVRGRRITPEMRPTIVHELTHALQAQHFDLEPEHATSGEDTAFTALVEADALRVQDAYLASLPEALRAEIQQAETAGAAPLADVPPILAELFSLPYVLGPPFLQAVEASEGEAGLDRAFRRPPTSEEHIVDPASYLGGDRPVRVRAPRLARGEEAVGEPDDFGMLSLLLVLGERLPFGQAWAAASGWSGDASVGYRQGGRDCIKVRVRLDTAADAEELFTAVRTWGAERDVRSSRRGPLVDFASCDPGTDAPGADPARPRTFELVQLRGALLTSLGQTGLDPPTAACVADRVLREQSPARLLEVAVITDPSDERLVSLQRAVAAAIEGCKAG